MGHEFTKDMLTIGIGNVELIEPSVRVNVARNLNVPQDLVKVHLVAHHCRRQVEFYTFCSFPFYTSA